MADVNAVLDVEPRDDYALRVRASIQASRGKYPEALADYTQSLQVDPAANPFGATLSNGLASTIGGL